MTLLQFIVGYAIAAIFLYFLCCFLWLCAKAFSGRYGEDERARGMPLGPFVLALGGALIAAMVLQIVVNA